MDKKSQTYEASKWWVQIKKTAYVESALEEGNRDETREHLHTNKKTTVTI